MKKLLVASEILFDLLLTYLNNIQYLTIISIKSSFLINKLTMYKYLQRKKIHKYKSYSANDSY